MKVLIRLYSVLLRLFPAAFQAAFGAEMREVFTRSLAEARREGILAVLALLLREAVDLPASAMREHVYLLVNGQNPVAAASGASGEVTSLPQSRPPSSLLDAVLSGLPHLLVGSLMAFGPLLQFALGLEDQTSLGGIQIVPRIGLLVLVTCSLIAAIALRGKPWQASWYIYWLILVIAGLQFLTDLTGFNPLRRHGNTVIYFILPLVMAYTLYRVTRASRVAGALAALPLMLLTWFPFMEHSPMHRIDPGWEGLTHLVVWSGGALTAFAIARGLRAGPSVLLALGIAALAGIPYTIIGATQGGILPFDEPGPTPGAMLRIYVPHLVGVSTLVLGPQLARSLREMGLRAGRYGRWAYRLALFGLLLSFAGVLLDGTSNFISDLTPYWLPSLARPFLDVGTPIFVVAFCLLAVLAWKAGSLPGALDAALLITLGFTPFALLPGLPPMELRHWAVTAPVLAAAAGWMGIAVWVVVRQTRIKAKISG